MSLFNTLLTLTSLVSKVDEETTKNASVDLRLG